MTTEPLAAVPCRLCDQAEEQFHLQLYPLLLWKGLARQLETRVNELEAALTSPRGLGDEAVDPMALRSLESGEKYPYDDEVAPSPDFAHRAARGILYDLSDRGGIKHELDAVDSEVRTEIVSALAAIIRAAASRTAPQGQSGDGVVKGWPFVESPGDFTNRLSDALTEFNQDLLAAVRNVLIENPPTFLHVTTAQPIDGSSAPAPSCEPEIFGPFVLGNWYRTQGGEWVKLVGVHNKGNVYETVVDQHGHHRYTREYDAGRVTGSAFDFSDPKNIVRQATPPVHNESATGELAYDERVAVGVFRQCQAQGDSIETSMRRAFKEGREAL